MANILMLRAPLFPYNPAIDAPKEHLHLMLIYLAVWTVQLGYALYAANKWRHVIKERATRKSVE